MKSFILLMSLGYFEISQASTMTIEQCLSTVQARASLSISESERQLLCENHSQIVVDCTIDHILNRPLSMNFSKALKNCQRDLIRYLR